MLSALPTISFHIHETKGLPRYKNQTTNVLSTYFVPQPSGCWSDSSERRPCPQGARDGGGRPQTGNCGKCQEAGREGRASRDSGVGTPGGPSCGTRTQEEAAAHVELGDHRAKERCGRGLRLLTACSSSHPAISLPKKIKPAQVSVHLVLVPPSPSLPG